MAKILNYGSINIDHVYEMDHFVQPGETTASLRLEHLPGGKGLNQSIALARAGAEVYHLGKVGPDGSEMIHLLAQADVHTGNIATNGSVTGHAIIQVEKNGQNCIILHHGANFEITVAEMQQALQGFGHGDILLLQNEVNDIDLMINLAHARGMYIAINPSPIGPEIEKCDLSKVTWFLLNEIEGHALTGESEPRKILDKLEQLYPRGLFVLTIGKQGVLYREAGQTYSHGVFNVEVVDTTAAGDTFTGFFLSAITNGKNPAEALRTASAASSIAVSRNGAAVSIPTLREVRESQLDLM